MATLDDYIKRITGKDEEKKEEPQVRFERTNGADLHQRLREYASAVGSAYDNEQKYIASLSPTDQSAYKRVKESKYVYSSPYLKKGREGKADLEYGDTNWNALSKEEKEKWFDTVERNKDADWNSKDIPWEARYAHDIMEASQTTNVGAFGANKKQMFDIQSEQKWMWFSLPANVREGLQKEDKSAIDYIKKNYSPDEVSFFEKYAKAAYNAELEQNVEEMQRDLLEDNALYATVGAPLQNIGADVFSAMVAAPRTLWDLAKNRGNYDVVDPYAGFFQRSAAAGQAVQRDIMEGLENQKELQKLYGNSISVAESAIRLTLARGVAKGVTKAFPGVNFENATNIIMNGMMFPSVVTQTANEMTMKGVPASQALAKATFSGIFECLFETLSFDKLGFFQEKPVVGSVKTFVKNLLKSGFVEGSEEVATDIANEMYDYFAMYDWSDYKAFKDTLEAKKGRELTDDEAWKAYSWEFASKLWDSFAGGAFSGITMGAISNKSAIDNYNAYKTLGLTVDDATASRMTPVIDEMMDNPNIRARMDILEDDDVFYGGDYETIRRGAMKDIFDQMSASYEKNIEKATEKSLPTIMDNINRNLNGVISENLINKYNAKMVEFGKGDLQVDYAKLQENINKGNKTTFSDLAYGTGEGIISQNISKAREEYGEARNAVTNAGTEEEYKEAVGVAMAKREALDKQKDFAEDMVARYAVKGIEMDSPEVMKYASDIGFEKIARIYSDVKLGKSKLPAVKSGGAIRSITDEEIKSVLKDVGGHVQTVDYETHKGLKNFRTAYAFAKIYSKMTGLNVALFASDRADGTQNGAISAGRNTVYIDINAGYSAYGAAIGQAFGHENTHFMKTKNYDGWTRLRDFVKDDFGEEKYKAYVKDRMERFKLSEEDAEDEVIAEACQNMLKNSDVFRRYAIADFEGAKSFRDRLVEFLNKFRRFIRDAFKGEMDTRITAAVKDIEGLQKVYDEILEEVVEGMPERAAEGIIENKPSVAENIVGTELVTEDSVRSSQRMNAELMDRAKKMFAKVGRDLDINYQDFYRAIALCNTIANRMLDPNDLASYLPEDIPGKVEVGNASYGRSMENAMECIRSIVNNDFTDMVSEAVGRPLTVEEQLVASQILQIVNSRPECNYCYVATDRRAYRASFGTYFKQYEDVYNKVAKNRDAFSKDLNGAEKRMEEVKVDGGEKNLGNGVVAKAYAEFLNGRKNTPDMRKRFLGWVNSAVKGEMPISRRDLTSARVRDKAREDATKKWFIDDAEKYAQSATWAKKVSRVIKVGGKNYVAKYVSYNGSILKWNQTLIDKLNEEFGLRMYSFSDYVPAFILENMQMIIDASLRGLKVLAYTKDCGFAEAFAETGAGINISLFGTLDKKAYKDENLNALREAYKANKNDATRKAYLDALNQYVVRDGIGGKDGMMGANWDRASALRKTYKNVGTVFVATNDDLVEWALANPEIDVVIPYHLVRTGEEVAAFFDYKNFKAQQEDKKTKAWTSANLKSIPPTVHGNDLATYKQALKDNNLEPRFADFIDNPNYMKLVNETRLSYKEMKPVQPIFDQSIIEREVGRIKDEGQYGLMPGFKTKAEQDAFIENQNLVGQAVDAIGEWNESGKKPIDDNIRYSFRDKKISSDMSDSQRESVIRNMPPMTVIDYSNEVNYDNDATEPKKYRNDYYKINVGISNKNIDESVVRGRMDAETLQKWRPRIQAALKNAVGLEAHTNRYYFDVDTEEYRNLIGGFIDGENFVPIRFGIKIGKNNKASTYIVLVSDAIKKDKVIGGHSTHPTDVQTGTPNLSEINIAKVLENVNDKYLFEFIPDGILKTDEKIGIKRKLIASSLDEVAKKNNVRYTGFLKRGFDVEAKHMLERGLMNNGFFIDKKSNIARLTSNPNITRSLELRVYDESGREIPFSERIAVTQEELNASRKSDKGNKNGGNKKNKGNGTRFSTRMSMAELDEAYENAYNEYDDDRMQELVDIAAEKAGYKYKAFHHTESNFTVFDLAKARKSMDIQAFFFSADPNAESEYGSKRYDVFLKMENPYIVDSKESAERIPFDLSKENAGVTAREWLLENGYDSVIRKADYYGAEADEYVVLNANQIKSADTVTYDDNGNIIPLSERFNDGKNDIRYSVRTLSDGTEYVYLDGNIFLREDGTEMSPTEAYRTLVDKKVSFPDGIILVNYLPGDKNMYNELFKNGTKNVRGADIRVMNGKINRNFEEILMNSSVSARNIPDKDERHKENKIESFDKRTVLIADDNCAYKLNLSIANLTDGRKVAYAKSGLFAKKAIWEKIKKETVTSKEHKSRDLQPSNENISQSETDVNRMDDVSINESNDEQKETLTGNDILYSRRVDDKKTLDFLNNQDYITTYRSFQVINGGLYSPMNQGREGYESVLGEWEESTEIKDFEEAVRNKVLVPKKNGGYDYNLKAGKNTTSGKNRTTKAAYNPYLHSSNSVLNDQFAAAYDRPNLVVVECHVPKSEEARPYWAKNATDPVGWKEWKSGKASTELAKSGGEARGVFLSRWMKPVRILPYSEVAQMYKDALEGTDITIAWNVVPPGLRHELEKIGVPIDYSYKNGSVTFENVFPDEAYKANGTRYSIRDSVANYTDERIDRLLRQYGAKHTPNYAQAYAAYISPDDFLMLTTNDLGAIERESRELNEQELRDNPQEIFLKIEEKNGKMVVYGHEGRHRMVALRNQGVSEVAISVIDLATKYTKEITDSMTLSHQIFNEQNEEDFEADIERKAEITDLVPISYENEDILKRRFTGEHQVKFSYRDLANSESEILVNALKNDAALVDELGAKQSIEAYAREYNRLKEMENQQIEITKQLRKKDTSPSEREALLKKMVRLDRAILNKTTELTEMRNQRVIRDLLISEWDKRDTLVAAGRAEERYLTRKALEEKYGKELSALKEKTRQQKQEIRDRHTINERKARIIKKTKQLMDMCLHPTEKKKVPTVLINPVVELLDAIDYWTPAEGRRVTKKSESLRERFVNFREAINEYQEQINEGTEQIEYMFDPEFLETVDELAKSVKGINNVNDMNAEEITALDQTLTQLYHLISRGNKMITASHYQTVNEYTDKTRQAMEKRKTLSEKTSAKGSWLSRLNAGMSDTYAFGEYAGEGTREIVDMLSKAFEDKEFHVKEAIEFTQEVLKPYKKELKKWSQDEHEFTLSTTDKDGNPNKVKLTVGQMMELYLLNKREQARGHIYGGGIRVENRKGKFTESVKIAEQDVAEIMEYLKSVPGAMEVADKLQQYGATTITGWGNQASNLMYGISKFTDENYWQIRSDSSALKDNENTEKALNASMYRLQNMGRTKAVKKGANNAIYIGDVFDTWSKTIDEMTSYASILPATTDAMRWWNSRVELDGENTVRVKKLLESKLGTDMTRVFTDTIKALNGGIMGTDSLESLVKKLTGKAKAAAVAGNLRVVLQQPTAYTRAAAVIDKKYLLKALMTKPNAKEAQEHSAIAWHKAQGFYSNGLAPSLRKMVIGDASIGENLTEKALWLAGKADDLTWGYLWNASKLKVEAENKALKVGSDAYWNEVNKVFSNIINQTQVVDTPLTKSTWMRGNGLGVYFTAFMAEPTKTYSMVMERLDRVLQNPTSKDAWRAFAGVGAVFAVNAMVNAMAQALADAARDDDKEKDYWEKYIEKYQEDVKDNINPLTYIPVVKDIWSLSQGYSNSNLSMQAAQNTVYAVNELKKIANGTSKKTLFGQAETVAKAISGWTGIPVGNVMRTLNSIGNVAGVDIFRRKKYTNSELGRNVVLSMNEGDTSAADKYMAELVENCKGDTNKANNYVITYLAGHDNEIDAWAERYMEDATTINDAIDAMSDKYSAEIVTKAIRKSVNNDADEDDKIKTSTLAESQYTSDDINRMLEKGKVTEAQDIIDEINAKYKEMGSKTTAKNAVTAYWKPKYLAASGAERDKILKMLYKLKNNGQQMYSSKDIAKWS